MTYHAKSPYSGKNSLKLENSNDELAQLYVDLQESFETLCRVNTKLQAANEKLEKQNKLQHEFINVAAHELRTPTQSVVGYCEMLELFPERLKQYLPRLRRNADRLWALTANLLDATKIDADVLKLNNTDFNLTSLVRDVAREMKRKFNLINNNTGVDRFSSRLVPKIEMRLPSDRFVVHADKDRTAQVLFNLLDNAYKFTSSGTITITVQEDANNFIKISVKDTGKGIDTNIKPKLFGRFVTNSENGTGLGLFISKNIVQAQGGNISAENNKNGAGATFSFTLPNKNKVVKNNSADTNKQMTHL
jgi:signal transduction histidine kinase